MQACSTFYRANDLEAKKVIELFTRLGILSVGDLRDEDAEDWPIGYPRRRI